MQPTKEASTSVPSAAEDGIRGVSDSERKGSNASLDLVADSGIAPFQQDDEVVHPQPSVEDAKELSPQDHETERPQSRVNNITAASSPLKDEEAQHPEPTEDDKATAETVQLQPSVEDDPAGK